MGNPNIKKKTNISIIKAKMLEGFLILKSMEAVNG